MLANTAPTGTNGGGYGVRRRGGQRRWTSDRHHLATRCDARDAGGAGRCHRKVSRAQVGDARVRRHRGRRRSTLHGGAPVRRATSTAAYEESKTDWPGTWSAVAGAATQRRGGRWRRQCHGPVPRSSSTRVEPRRRRDSPAETTANAAGAVLCGALGVLAGRRTKVDTVRLTVGPIEIERRLFVAHVDSRADSRTWQLSASEDLDNGGRRTTYTIDAALPRRWPAIQRGQARLRTELYARYRGQGGVAA